MESESYQNIGKNIRQRMTDLKLTQQDLADTLHVSRQTINSWVRTKAPVIPRSDDLPAIASALRTTVGWLYSGATVPNWIVKEKMFDEEHMYTRLKTVAITEHLNQFAKALSYAKKEHAGVLRKPSLYTEKTPPYIIHPLMMACHAHALGIHDDEVLASIMLHDVCEDCGVKPEELPFPKGIQDIVALLTKDPDHKHDENYTAEYYHALMMNPKSAIIKALDRCNNVSTMAGSFRTEKLVSYIQETEEYGYPLFDYIKENYLEYNDAIYVIKYQVMSLVETVKCMQKGATVHFSKADDSFSIHSTN